MSHIMTADEVVDALLDIIDRQPDNLNPTNPDGTCRYTSTDNPDHHCIIGQLAVERGWVLTDDDEGTTAWVVADDNGWPVGNDAKTTMALAQEAADTATNKGLPWSTIRPQVEDLRPS